MLQQIWLFHILATVFLGRRHFGQSNVSAKDISVKKIFFDYLEKLESNEKDLI